MAGRSVPASTCTVPPPLGRNPPTFLQGPSGLYLHVSHAHHASLLQGPVLSLGSCPSEGSSSC